MKKERKYVMATRRNTRTSPYPYRQDTVRPFRMWDTRGGPLGRGGTVPYRYYSDLNRCRIGALIEMKTRSIGEVVEVIDVRIQKYHGAYKRTIKGVDFIDVD